MKMKKILFLFIILCLFGCQKTGDIEQKEEIKMKEEMMGTTTDIKLLIDNKEVEVEWLDNDSVKALEDILMNEDIEIKMSTYGGFEQVGSIGHNIPADDVQLKTKTGDIVLYNGNQLVIFFGSNSWSYTKLGHIDGLSDQEIIDLLINHDVVVRLEVNHER